MCNSWNFGQVSCSNMAFLVLLDYVSCPSPVRLWHRLPLKLLHGILWNFSCGFPWAICMICLDVFFLLFEKKGIFLRIFFVFSSVWLCQQRYYHGAGVCLPFIRKLMFLGNRCMDPSKILWVAPSPPYLQTIFSSAWLCLSRANAVARASVVRP